MKPWEFGYVPIRTAAGDDDGEGCDLIVATEHFVDADVILDALSGAVPDATVETVLTEAPLFWTRVRASARVLRADVTGHLLARKIPLRYVASALRGSLLVPPELDFRGKQLDRSREDAWPKRPARAAAPDPSTEGRWCMRAHGLTLDRAICGTGAGMRLAVVDDGAAEAHHVDTDAEVLVGIDEACRTGTFHGPLMMGWAVGTKTFRGVAPDASPRLYCVPKPGVDMVSVPAAIVRGVADGADVLMCATYIEGSASPMLDDALEFAMRAGRRGRGTPVIFPTGREASSPGNSVHASWTLGLGEPASDPRVLCVGPSARFGGWFLWKGHKGVFRPFANRGPAVRWLAPGDDVHYPFEAKERLFHAESSGASAFAAGALLLVLASNPTLRVSELAAIVSRATDSPPLISPSSHAPLADAHDMLPIEPDRDGHNAKHGYGRINVTRACVMAADPIAMAMATIGEDDAAIAFTRKRREDRSVKTAYSRTLGRWMVRALLRDPLADHALRVLVRHARLIGASHERRRAHGSGAVVRQLALLLRSLVRARGGAPSVRRELEALAVAATQATALPSDAQAALEDALVDAVTAGPRRGERRFTNIATEGGFGPSEVRE